jgi:hypothetical protein
VAAGKSSAVADMLAQGAVGDGLLMAHTPAASGEGEQADLLREVGAFSDELALFEGGAIRPPKRGPGRPPGSPSRSTLRLKQLMQAKGYRDPLEFLASLWTMDTRQLATELRPDAGEVKARGLDGKVTLATFDQAHEAAKLQVRAAEAALPYWHQKTPVAVHHSGDSQRPVIIIHDMTGAAAKAAQDSGAMSVHDVVEYQEVSSDAPQSSDDEGRASDG